MAEIMVGIIGLIFSLIEIAIPIAIIIVPIVLIAKAVKRHQDIAEYNAETERIKAQREKPQEPGT